MEYCYTTIEDKFNVISLITKRTQVCEEPHLVEPSALIRNTEYNTSSLHSDLVHRARAFVAFAVKMRLE